MLDACKENRGLTQCDQCRMVFDCELRANYVREFKYNQPRSAPQALSVEDDL